MVGIESQARIAQWIERWPPEPKIRVRIPIRVHMGQDPIDFWVLNF